MTQASPHRDERHALPGKLQEGPHSGRVRRQPQPPRLCRKRPKPDRALPSSSKPPSPRRARGALLLKVLLWVYSKCAAGGATSRRGAGRARLTHRMAPRTPRTMAHAQKPQRAPQGIHRIRKTTAHRARASLLIQKQTRPRCACAQIEDGSAKENVKQAVRLKAPAPHRPAQGCS